MIRLIHRTIEFSVRHTVAVLIAVTCCCAFGFWCMSTMKLDAIPDLGDTQVIIYSRWDRSPEILESQVTYPIVTAMLGAPHVKTVRGVSDFGYSYVYVIFDDNTDLYWARRRCCTHWRVYETVSGQCRSEPPARLRYWDRAGCCGGSWGKYRNLRPTVGVWWNRVHGSGTRIRQIHR